MSYFVSDETYRIGLREHDGSDEWVDIKDELTDKDQRRFIRDMQALGADMQVHAGGTLELRAADAAAYIDVFLPRVIVAWSLPMPVSPAAIDGLKGGLSGFLFGKAQAHYNAQRLSAEEEKNSSGPPSPASSTAAPSPNGSPVSSFGSGSASTPTVLYPSAVTGTPRSS